MRRTLATILLIAYLIFLLIVTLLMFFKDDPAHNPIPFRSIVHDCRVGGRAFVVNFLGNVGVFVPIGLLVPLVRSRPTHAGRMALLCLVLSGSIEATQYLSGRRVADVDDLLLNVAGGMLGYLIIRSIRPDRGSSPRCPTSGRLLR